MTTIVRDRTTARTASPALVPIAIGVGAALISLVGMTVPSIWYDEAATISSATRTWPQLWAEVQTVDAVHAVYYALLHLVFDVVGYSPFSLRLPSALAVGVGAALTVVLGRQLGRASLGIVGGIVFAVLPRITWAGSEGRSSAITAALAVGLTVALVHALRSPRKRSWVLYGVLAVVACTVFVYLALLVLAHGIAVAILRTHRRRWVVSAASAALVVLPFAVFVIRQKGQIDWLPPLGSQTWRQVFSEQWFMNSDVFAVVAWLLLAVGALTVLRSRSTDDRAAILLPLITIPTIVLIGATLVAFPVYTPRYLTMCLPFVALLIAAALDAAPWRTVRVVALVAVVALAVPAFVASRQADAKEANWRSVAELIQAQKSRGSAIIFGTVQKHPTATARVIEYAYPDAFGGTMDVTLATPAAETGRLWETTRSLPDSLALIAQAPDVFLVTSKSRDQRPQTALTLAAAGWHEVEQWSLAKVNVVKYER